MHGVSDTDIQLYEVTELYILYPLYLYNYRSLWNMRNYIHVMLCANLSVSQLIFVIGIEQTSNKVRDYHSK